MNRFVSHDGRAFACVLALFACACGTSTTRTTLEAPSDIPRFDFDVKACEVRVKGAGDAGKVFDTGMKAVWDMVQARPGKWVPARFRATVDAGSGMYALWPLCFLANVPDFFLYSGACTNTSYHAKVHLEVEITGSGTWVGDGSASHGTTDVDEEAWLATVHNAFQDAFMNAKKGAPEGAKTADSGK